MPGRKNTWSEICVRKGEVVNLTTSLAAGVKGDVWVMPDTNMLGK